jgi:Radical SAM superfamily
MLIKVTNYCSMGCSHCMEDSTIKGQHMPFDTFLRALDFTKRIERLAWETCLPLVLLSGGECTEHPEIVRIIEEVIRQHMHPVLITNGTWLANPELRDAILRPEWPLFVQVTNDPRFYPRSVPQHDDARITFVPSLTHLITLGRAGRKKNLDAKGLPLKKAPTSFNFRSLTRGLGSADKAIAVLRMKAMQGLSGHCSPSISEDGSVVAGETRFCFKVGTVDSTIEEVTRATIAMQCNACGLVDGLTQEQKRAIGESAIYLGTES